MHQFLKLNSYSNICEIHVEVLDFCLSGKILSTWLTILDCLCNDTTLQHYTDSKFKAIYSGTKYYDTHIEFHSLFLDVSSTDF